MYDSDCVWSREDDFFVTFVNETPAARVLDLGCGTGRLTLALAAAAHEVTGVDPAAASLAVAREKPFAERVTWVEGTSSSLPADAFDVAVMSAHVAQFLVDDAEWRGTLRDIRRTLVAGGRLVFDTRDPRAAEWERWNPNDSRRLVPLPDGTDVEVWGEVETVHDGVVACSQHYLFSDGTRLISTMTMRWRSDEEVRAAVTEAGLVVDEIYGGWGCEPIDADDGELLVVAHRPWSMRT